MPKEERPIRIKIPSELRLTRDQITSLDNVFKEHLHLIEDPNFEPLPFSSINTTKFAVDIDVVRPPRRPKSKAAKKPGSKKKK